MTFTKIFCAFSISFILLILSGCANHQMMGYPVNTACYPAEIPFCGAADPRKATACCPVEYGCQESVQGGVSVVRNFIGPWSGRGSLFQGNCSTCYSGSHCCLSCDLGLRMRESAEEDGYAYRAPREFLDRHPNKRRY